MTEKNKGRVVTVVFEIEDNEKFKPVWDSMRATIDEQKGPLGARTLVFAEGDRMREQERQLNVWNHFAERHLMCGDHEFDGLIDELAVKHNWKNVEDWHINQCVDHIAEVWQPEEI